MCGLRIERHEETQLSAATDLEIADFLGSVFGTETADMSLGRQRHHLRLLMRDEADRLVAHLALCIRGIRLGAAPADIVGLAEVCTAPDRRGEGIATKVLRAAIAEARSSPAPFILLFGTAPLYAAHGFRNVGNPLRFLGPGPAAMTEICEERAHDLMVHETGGRAWPETATVDLLGRRF